MNILTFDLEDWYNAVTHGEIRDKSYSVVPIIERLIKTLERYKVKPTFFVAATFAERNPQLVHDLAQNYDMGSHGYSHKLVSSQTKSEFHRDIVRSLELLEQITNKKITKYRAPAFSLPDKDYLKVLFDTSVETDCSLSARNHFYGKKQTDNDCIQMLEYNGRRIKEFPPSVIGCKIFGDYGFLGGGYYRLLPYCILNDRLSKHKDYNLMYLHPSDFETSLPKVDGLSLFSRFRRSVGVAGAEKKLLKLLNTFTFEDIATADNKVDWANVPIMKL